MRFGLSPSLPLVVFALVVVPAAAVAAPPATGLAFLKTSTSSPVLCSELFLTELENRSNLEYPYLNCSLVQLSQPWIDVVQHREERDHHRYRSVKIRFRFRYRYNPELSNHGAIHRTRHVSHVFRIGILANLLRWYHLYSHQRFLMHFGCQ